MGAFLDSVNRARGRRAAGPRHQRRDDDPLVETAEHAPRREKRRLPAPNLSALLGVGVLVLIGAGAAHLAGSGSAVPVQEDQAGVITSAPAASTAPSVEPEEKSKGGTPTDAAQGSPSGSAEAVVHVSGAVAQPGVVRLPAGARVDDALRAVGGPTGKADLGAVNLARPVADGEQIHVPEVGEEPRVAPQSGTAASGSGGQPAGGNGGGDAAAGTAGTVDINTASAEQLQELPGVGPAIAQRIIDHRETNGPFTSVDDLVEVSGIGPKTLEKIRDRASVGP